MTADTDWLRGYVRDVADFPEPGIVFKDITPLLASVDAFRFAIDAIADHFCGQDIDLVVGVEARGFLFAAPLAYRCGTGLTVVRKAGKLPGPTATRTYDLEYGTGELEVHTDGINSGHRVLVVDDVLATGGTTAATIGLLEDLGTEVVGVAFLIELDFLDGGSKLEGFERFSLLHY